MLALLISLAIAQTTHLVGRDPLIDRKLPFYPIEHSKMLVTGGGDGFGFDVFPSFNRAFDPNKEMPDFQESTKGQTKIVWKPTPAAYFVTDNLMLRVTEIQNGQFRYHDLQAVRYSEKKPWTTIDHLIVLFFDHKAFAICINELGDDEGPGEQSDANLIEAADRSVKLDIGQYMSGTGAFNSHSLFEITPTGPKLIEIRESGRRR